MVFVAQPNLSERRTDDVHFGYVRAHLPVNTSAMHTIDADQRSALHRIGNIAHQMKMPRLCEAQRGLRPLQSAQTSANIPS